MKITDQPLVSFKFTNKETADKISAQVFNPQKKRIYLRDLKKWTSEWNCEIQLRLNGKRQKNTLSSDSWLGSFLLAVEFIRLQIPKGSEQVWEDDRGVECWCILPKSIPFAWGYGLFRRISDHVDEEELAFVNEIERRRHDNRTRKI